MSSLNRRSFLCVSAGAGSLAAVRCLWRHSQSDRSTADSASIESRALNLSTCSRTSWALGSHVTITLLHHNPRQGERALAAAFDELETIEQIMSIYRPHSQLSCLNREGLLRDPHPYLLDVLRTATAMSRRTKGAFDVTVQPLWALYRHAQLAGQIPAEDSIERTCRNIDWRNVFISSGHVELRGAGMAVTLNGIAQGFAADRVRAVLRAHGVINALIDTGELGSMGHRADGLAWQVGIQHPRDPAAFASVVQLAGRCLSTSGDYATSFLQDHSRHHVFDPHTGRSPTELSSVSVAAPTSMLADATSTAVFVLGADAGLALVSSMPNVDALLMTKSGRMLRTAGFPEIGPTCGSALLAT
jgi:thiamine biosynthesis lipoprotein